MITLRGFQKAAKLTQLGGVSHSSVQLIQRAAAFRSRVGAGCRALSMSQPVRGKLDGKVAVVTASTEGIGLAIAKDLGKNGAKVYISSRKESNVMKAIEDLKKDISVSGMVCHVSNAEDRQNLINKVVSESGTIDILVSNAAANPVFGPVCETTEASWDKIFDVNVKSSFLLVKDCVPHMEKKGGSIIFVSSIGGFHPFPGLGCYSVSKTALLGLTKVLASELAPYNIRVNCIAPGVIKTKFSEALWSNEAIKEATLALIPQKRLGKPEDCAGVVSFLASDEADYVTGEVITISGGMPSRL